MLEVLFTTSAKSTSTRVLALVVKRTSSKKSNEGGNGKYKNAHWLFYYDFWCLLCCYCKDGYIHVSRRSHTNQLQLHYQTSTRVLVLVVKRTSSKKSNGGVNGKYKNAHRLFYYDFWCLLCCYCKDGYIHVSRRLHTNQLQLHYQYIMGNDSVLRMVWFDNYFSMLVWSVSVYYHSFSFISP